MKNALEAVKLELIDYGPKFHSFGPDEILTVSGILTSKKGSFKENLENIDKNIVKTFHEHATKRGHASLLTTPVFYFWIEGSRMIDFFLSAFPFGSYLMFSSRRIEIKMDNMIIPDSIEKSSYKIEYEKVCKNLLAVYKKLLKNGFDQARNILPLGFTSYGFFSFPAQTLLTCINECETNKNIPEELKNISQHFKNILKSEMPMIFDAAEKASETGFTFPNLFSDCEIDEEEEIKVVYRGNIEKILEVLNLTNNWKKVSQIAQTEILVKVVSSISIGCWNEVKRHRTVRQVVEPVYTAAERYLKNPKDEYFHVPPAGGEEYKNAFHDAMTFYEKLVESGIEARDAIYIIPHALKVKAKLLLDGYHLLDPFGFIGIRSCTTTHYEFLKFAETICECVGMAIPELKELLGPKCKTGTCPEKKQCGKIKMFERKMKL